MNLQLFRIDDRLIHGQVVIGWANYFNSKNIILCDDSVCENDWEKELYLSIVPKHIRPFILTRREFSDMSKNGSIDFKRTIVVVASPFVLEDLLKLDIEPDAVNVGGIHFKEGRHKYLSYLYLNDEEISTFKRCMEHGIEFVCQDMPDSKKVYLKNILI